MKTTAIVMESVLMGNATAIVALLGFLVTSSFVIIIVIIMAYAWMVDVSVKAVSMEMYYII